MTYLDAISGFKNGAAGNWIKEYLVCKGKVGHSEVWFSLIEYGFCG